jgi:hypothetical protein
MAEKKKARIENLADKESSFGKVYKVAGPCNKIFKQIKN